MSTAVATRTDQPTAVEPPSYMEKLLNGDLSALTPEEKTHYYLQRCASIGLDPMSQPFLFMQTKAREGEQPKTILYATRGATDQIGKRDGLSGTIVSKEFISGVAIAVIRITCGGRSIENVGAASYKYENQLGDALKRAITQGYRRGIIQFSGLGMVSEDDIADISGAQLLGMHDVVLPEPESQKQLGAPVQDSSRPKSAKREWNDNDPAPAQAIAKWRYQATALREAGGEVIEVPEDLTVGGLIAVRKAIEAGQAAIVATDDAEEGV